MADTAEAQGVETKTRVFISYSRKDMAFANRLESALEARGFEVLIDREEIYAFEDWWKRIEALIGIADTIIFVLSPDAVNSDVALKEVAHGAFLNKRFAPIVCRRVEDNAVPEPLRRLNFIFFDEPARFDASADQLADALQTDIGWIRRHTEFGEAARRWVEAGRPGGMLLRPPMLDQAEAWVAFRPRGAPVPTADTEAFIAESRKAEVAARRRNRVLQASLYAMLVGIILGLVGWINQDYLEAKWRWFAIERPFAATHIWPYVLTGSAEQALKPKDTFKDCATEQGKDFCPEMVVVPAGLFVMGSQATEPGHSSSEQPLHNVTIGKPFAIATSAVTFDEWDTCAAYGDCDPDITDSGWGRGRQPVINVTWSDAQRYAVWLAKITGKPYRLLSEAEYEYAARAGTQTVYPWGDEIGKGHAACSGCGSPWDGRQPSPVGSFAPNQFGLYDMVGSVWEWVADCVHGNYNGAPQDGSAWIAGGLCTERVIRGGAFNSTAAFLRSGNRGADSAVVRNSNVGFRVARTLDTR